MKNLNLTLSQMKDEALLRSRELGYEIERLYDQDFPDNVRIREVCDELDEAEFWYDTFCEIVMLYKKFRRKN